VTTKLQSICVHDKRRPSTDGLSTDANRASFVASLIVSAFREGKGIFTNPVELVENQMPEKVRLLSREHALFLFYVVPQDHGVSSAGLYTKAKELHREDPDVFDPSAVVKLELRDIEKRVSRKLGVRYPIESSREWHENSRMLLEEYEGDPRKLFSKTKEAQKLLKEIRRFRGFGPKTGALLLRAISNLGFVELDNLEDVLLPVDVHDTRIAFYTRSLAGPNTPDWYVKNYMSYVRPVQEVWLSASQRAGLDWRELDRALWILGSKGCAPEKHGICPARDLCVKGEHIGGTNLL